MVISAIDSITTGAKSGVILGGANGGAPLPSQKDLPVVGAPGDYTKASQLTVRMAVLPPLPPLPPLSPLPPLP